MSAITVTALTTSVEELTGTLEGIGASAGALVTSPAVLVTAGVAAAVVLGKTFERIWNSNRRNIPGVMASLRNAMNTAVDIGENIQKTLTDWNNIKDEIISKNSLIKDIDNINIDIEKSIADLKQVDTTLFNQTKEWTQDIFIVYLAGSDNAFYTQNKSNIDTLINAYTSSGTHITSLKNTINKQLEVINDLIKLIRHQYEISLYEIISLTQGVNKMNTGSVVLTPPMGRGLAEHLRKRLEDLGKIFTGFGIGALIGDLLESISKTKTKTKTKKNKKEPKKKRPRFKNKKKPNDDKGKIKMIWMDTHKLSGWIARIEFIFPVKKDLESDDKGTMKFHLKEGGVIRFVRVKRGTFSVISQTYGTGYRLWSQFWKKRIVNKGKVLSWFIKRINPADREIGIEQEIKDKKVKYK